MACEIPIVYQRRPRRHSNLAVINIVHLTCGALPDCDDRASWLLIMVLTTLLTRTSSASCTLVTSEMPDGRSRNCC